MSAMHIEQLDRLMRTAARRQEPLAHRTASIRNMQGLLRTPQGQAAGQAMLPALWPAALMLLQDSQTEVRQAVAPLIGFLGALAARPNRPAGISPQLLFEWAMPVLSGTANAAGWSGVSIGVQCWVLVALKEGLAAVDTPTLNQHSHVVLTSCLHRLRSEATSVHLVAPMLGLISEAARHQASLRASFQGLVDSMVYWWLEPKLPDVVRPLLARTVESVKSGWRQHPAFGKAVLGKLLHTMGKALSDRAAVNVNSQTQFSRLNSCVEAVLAGCRAQLAGDATALLKSWVQHMERGYRKFCMLPVAAVGKGGQAPPADTFAEGLCTYMQHAITAASAQKSPPAQASAQAMHAEPSVQHPAVAPPTQSAAPQNVSAVCVLAKSVADFVGSVVTSSSNQQQAASAHRALQLAQSMVEALQQQRCSVSADITQHLLKLTLTETPSMLQEQQALQKLLLSTPATRLAAAELITHHIHSSTQQLAAADSPPDGTDMAALDKLQIVQQTVVDSQDALVCQAIWANLSPVLQHREALQDRASVLWLEILTLLHAAWEQTHHAGWQELMPMLEACASGSPQPDVHCLLIQWAADAVKLETQTDSSQNPYSQHHPAQSSSAQDLAPTAALSNTAHKPFPAFPLACYHFLTRYCKSSKAAIRLAAYQALLQVLQSNIQPGEQQILALAALACQSLTDTSQQVSQSCTQLLTALAAPAAFVLSSSFSSHSRPSSWQRHIALQPQQLSFQPDQLAKLLDWLSQGAPQVVSQPGRPSTSSHRWLEDIVRVCQSGSPESKLPTSFTETAWLAFQEAAKHCTAVRMRTHLGNPAQTFAALEQMVQSILSKLSSTSSPHPADSAAANTPLYAVPAARSSVGGSLLEPSTMLLEFMHALEKHMYCTYAGSCIRPGATGSAIAFYKSNRRVCEDWFARMRMLLLRTSAASNNHALTLHHAYARLADLKSQLRSLQAAAAAELAQQQQAEQQLADAQLTEQEQAEQEQAEQEQAEMQREEAAKKNAEAEALDKPHSLRQSKSEGKSLQASLHPSTPAIAPHHVDAQLRSQNGVPSTTHVQASVAQAPVPTSMQGAAPAQPAAKSLLEIQAEQAAESAASKAAAFSPSRPGNKPARSKLVHSPALTGSQAKVLQVKRPKAGQTPAVNGAAVPVKVVPLPRPAASKLAVPDNAPVPGKVKLMARTQDNTRAPTVTGTQQDSAQTAKLTSDTSASAQARQARADSARRLARELQEVLRHATLALLRLSQPEQISGLQTFCSTMFGPAYQLAAAATHADSKTHKGSAQSHHDSGSSAATRVGHSGPEFEWMQAVALQAANKHEDAAVLYGQLLAEGTPGIGQQKQLRALLTGCCCEAYSAVSDWEGLQQWLQDVKGNQSSYMSESDSALSPAQEHVSDALAAFDAGHLQEAQNAFDLSVWADVKNDKGAINAAEAAEASTLKALMQLNTSLPAKQRVVRERRIARSMLQDAQDTLIHSLAITSQSGLDQTIPQLVQLHCLAAVQDSLPPVAPNPSDLDAPPGFAPKNADVPPPQSLLLPHLWPYSNAPGTMPGDTAHVDMSPHDPKPMLKLLRVHQQLKDKLQHDVQQRLQLTAIQAASASRNYKLASRLAADLQGSSWWSCTADLLETQDAYARGQLDTGTASRQLGQTLQRLHKALPAADHVQSTSVVLLLQLSQWNADPQAPTSPAQDSLKDIIQQLSTENCAFTSSLPAHCTQSLQQTCLHAALSVAPQSATAWLAYADYLSDAGQLDSSSSSPHTPDTQEVQAHAMQQGLSGTPEAPSTDHHNRCLEALQAYCRYCALASQSVGSAGTAHDCMAMLLKMLQLISGVSSSTETVTAATDALQSVPPLLWRAVVPQLFALTAHEEHCACELARELLQKLGSVDAAAVLYPALVEAKRVEKGLSAAKPSLQALLQGFQARQPELVQQVKQMMTELECISVLPTEQWHITLLDLQAEVARRIPTLQQELARINALQAPQQKQAMHERYQTVFAPAIHMIQQSLASSAEADFQTPQQKDFAFKTLPALRQAAAAFCKPTDQLVMHPELAWSPFKALARVLAQQLSLRELQLDDLSPVLAQLTSTSIPMPGASAEHLHNLSGASKLPVSLTVAAFKPAVHVMSTKTRPKRIGLVGSDGKTYTFLLKGWEDLRLDERMMQMVRTFATTLQSNAATGRKQLLPRSLSVIPLGPSAGLIQWVDHTMPLYGVYKTWQQRQIADRADAGSETGQSGAKSVPAQPPRAADAFYAKLFPALEAAGVPRSAPRKDWPLPVLRHLLAELIQETPHQLLARELWCATGSAAEWWSFQSNYTSSTAAMSMVGYLLGLGDRHLDNILLNKHTGRVVHIDYNIIFDKGRQLRVPEIVPFRLTPTLQAALGVTGVEGAFRKGCESILEVSRQHAADLTRLLQAVLTDPLIQWGGERKPSSKKDWDAAVALKLFCTRLSEADQPLTALLFELIEALPASSAASAAYEAIHASADEAAAAARAAHQQVQEAQATLAAQNIIVHKQHAASQASQAAAVAEGEALRLRFRQAQASLPQLNAELQTNEALLQSRLRECQGWKARHDHIVHALRDELPPQLMLPEQYWILDQAPTPIGLVMTLGPQGSMSTLGAALQAAPTRPRLPPQLLQQVYALDQQAAALLAQRQQALLAGVAGLQAYAAALRLVLDSDYTMSSHHSVWEQAITAALNTDSTEALQAACKTGPVIAGPADAVSLWRALKQMPSHEASALQHVRQQLPLVRDRKQHADSRLSEANADLQECLSEAQAEHGNLSAAVRGCMKALVHEVKASNPSSTFQIILGCANMVSKLASEQLPGVEEAFAWTSAFTGFIKAQTHIQTDMLGHHLLPLLGHAASPGITQFVEELGVLHSRMSAVEAAEEELYGKKLQYADLVATYHQQVAALHNAASHLATDSEVTTKLQHLQAAWEDRHNMAEGFKNEETIISAQAEIAVRDAQQLVFAPARLQSTAAHMTQPLYRMLQKVSQLANLLYSVAAAAEQLPGYAEMQPQHTAAGKSWTAVCFAISTLHSILITALPQQNLVEVASVEGSDRQHSNTLDSVVALLHSAFDTLNQEQTLPCLTAQLELTAEALYQLCHQQSDADEQVLEDLSHLEIDPILQQVPSSSTPSASAQSTSPQQPPLPDLAPFSDFDPALPGADDMLESADSDPSQANAGMEANGLVAFTDFDANLEGADELLELDDALESSNTPQSSQNQSAAASDSAQDSGSNSDSSEAQHLSQAMLQYLQCAGAVATADLQEKSLMTAQPGLQSLLERDTERELVGLEWLYEPALQEALQPQGGLGQPAVISPQIADTVPGWSLSTRRSHILRILEQVLTMLASTDDSWQSWRESSAQMEVHLQSHLVSNQDQYNAFSQLLQERQQWLAGCEELAGWLDRTTQSVLQLEQSREGFVWSRSAGADSQPFADCQGLMQQRLQLMTSRHLAQEEVASAEAQLPQLQQQAQAAAALLQPAQLQQRQQGQAYAQQAPKLLQCAEALSAPVKKCCAVMGKAGPRLQGMHKDLTQLAAQLQGSAAAAPVLESIAAVQKALGDSCTSTEQLQTRLGSLLTALESVSGPGKVLSSDGKAWKGPQSKAKRAALVMDAMRDAVTGVVQLGAITEQAPNLQHLAKLLQAMPQQAKSVAANIQQANTAARSPTAAGLPSRSQVADAQPVDGSEGSAMSLGPPAVGTAEEGVSASVKGSSTAPESSQADSQPTSSMPTEAAGDDLEQASKQELKVGQHSALLLSADDQQDQRAQREAFANATLKVVKAKLAGHDMRAEANAAGHVSVEKHVDHLIKQATSLTTLCQMYEGWTAWI